MCESLELPVISSGRWPMVSNSHSQPQDSGLESRVSQVLIKNHPA